MKRVSGKCFCDQDVRLDGYEYFDCSFQGCRFVYFGRKEFGLVGNIISPDCVVAFRGVAAKTISALSDMYNLGDWGRRHVQAMLGQITEQGGKLELPTH